MLLDIKEKRLRWMHLRRFLWDKVYTLNLATKVSKRWANWFNAKLACAAACAVLAVR